MPSWFYIGAAIIVALLVLAIALPWSRHKLRDRVQPILRQVGPRFLTLTQRPAKLAEGIGGILIASTLGRSPGNGPSSRRASLT